jgi:2-hydroxy-3-keto-5-methylthiopentenyl-1-phosphate phosphatase
MGNNKWVKNFYIIINFDGTILKKKSINVAGKKYVDYGV